MNFAGGDAMNHLLIALAFVVTLIVPACVGTSGVRKKERTTV
jgi:hypothetical protein